MSKEINIANYQAAYDILTGIWYPIDPCDYYEEDSDEFPLHAHYQSPLSLILKEEAWNGLSNEAKEMVNVVLNSPSEILELISTPKSGNITKRSIRKYFSIIWKSRIITNLTIKEITRWVNKL